MGLEELKNEIIEKANKEAATIEAAANQEANKIIDEAKSQVKEMQKIATSEAEKSAANLERKEVAKSNFEVKKQMLDKKQEMINNVVNLAREQIIGMSTDKNKQLFEKLLSNASKQMEISTLFINQKDKAFVKNYSWLSADIMGGFIAENKDKTMRIDCSYDTLLDLAKNKTMGDVVKTLFG